MKTKFIGLEGYQEIEHVSSKKKKAKKLNTAQKTVRFIKRAVSLGKKKLLNRKKKNTAVLKKNTAVQRTKKTNQTSVLERQYLQSRTAATGSGSAMESLKYLKNKPAGKTYQHSAPEEPRKRGFVKKKAVLAVAACLTAIMLSCVTVASALDSPAKNAQKNDNSAPKAAALSVATADEVKYDLDTPGFCVNASLSSLYIDGELIGTTNESEALDNALNQVLLDARAAYDDTTTTEFLNVKVEKLGFDNTALMTADELMEKAEGRFSIKLETDWSYDIELDYDTDVTYDEDGRPVRTYPDGAFGEVDGYQLPDFKGVDMDALQKEDAEQKAAEQADFRARVNYTLLTCYAFKEDFEKTIEYARLVRMTPNNTYYSYFGRYSEAFAMMRLAKMGREGYTLEDAKRKYDEELAFFRGEMIKANESSAFALLFRTRMYAELGKYGKAEELAGLMTDQDRAALMSYIEECRKQEAG